MWQGQADDSTSVTTTFAYDSTTAGKAGLPTSETVPVTTVSPAVSRTTAYTYNVYGEVLSQTQPGDSYAPSQRTVNTYDELGNALTTAQFTPSNATSANTTTTNVYDARNRVTSSTTVSITATTTTTRAFDIAGDVITATKPDGTSTASTYDGLGQLLTDQAAGFNATTHSYDGLGNEISLVEPAPANGTTTTTRVFDLNGQTTSETVDTGGTPATTSHVFDLLGRETSSTDPSGLATTTTYDDMSRVTRTVAGTQITDKSYDKDGRVTSGTAPYASGDTQVVSKSVYDNLGRATSTVTNYIAGSSDPSANLTTLNVYDAAGDKVASLDPAGVDTRTAFDINGGAEQTIVNCTDTNPGTPPGSGWATCTGGTAAAHDGTWNVTTTASTTANQSALTTTSTSVVAGVTTTTTSDGDGRVLESIVDPGTAPHLNLKTEHAYDSSGRQIAIQSAAGVVTVTDYDDQGRVVAMIVNCTNATPGALPGTSWASCTGAGAHDGTWNQVTSSAYDDAGNKVMETVPNGTVTTYAYDDSGNLVTQVDNWVPAGTDPDMNVTTNFYYDADGNRIASTSPTASGSYAITRDFYDTSGRLTSEIVNCTSSGTTPDANPATCTGQGTHNAQTNVTTSYSYDAAGNKLSVTAPSPANGATGTATVTTRYAYGANNKLCRVLESATVNPADLDNPCTDVLPSGAPHTTTQNVDTQYGYDSADNLASQTTGAVPAAGVVAGTTTWVYDGQGNVTSETDPDGNVDGATDAIRAAHTKTFTYDAAGNTTGETDPDTASGAGPTISYAFDAADRQCRRVAANPGVVLQTLANPCSTAATGATIDTRYGYDAAGNQISATDALASRTISSTYDQLSRPLTVSGDQTGDPGTTYTYDFDNPTRTDPSGAYTASLDAYGRQVGLTDPLHSSGNLYSWTYAPSGDVATSSDPTGNTTTNTYDPLGRPTARSTSGASGCSTCAAYTFTYNNAGNELTRVSTISGDTANGTTTFAYDALDRVTTYTPPAVISPQTYTWNGQPDRASIQTGTGTPLTVTFDAAGRPISDSSSGTYSSDGQGRITAVPGKTMTYDALGRLTRVVAGASTANYTYDALDRLRTINVGAATNRFRYVGTTDAVAQIIDNLSGTVLTNHATDLDGTELFDFAPGGSSQVYLGRNDHGDVTWSATTTGAVSARVSYDPYGNVAASSGTTPASRWQGSYYDSTSGFYYVNARWYAPSLGTFLSED